MARLDVESITYRALIGSEIRLLEIVPSHGDVNDRVNCKLVTKRLGPDLDFVALSSLIGEGDSEIIVVNGRKASVPGNVAQGLRHLRQVFLSQGAARLGEKRKDSWMVQFYRKVGSIFPADPGDADNNTILVWLDLLCLSPHSEQEKAKRRITMHEIFQAARMTVGWLGLADELSGMGVDTMEDISRAMPQHFGQPGDQKQHPENYSPRHEWLRKIEYVWQLPIKNDFDNVYEGDYSKALTDFLSRQYFRRDWILEEIASAAFPAFLVGDRIVSWMDVLRMNRVMEELRDHESDVFPSELRPLVYSWPLGTTYTLLRALEKCQRQESSWSRSTSVKSHNSELSNKEAKR